MIADNQRTTAVSFYDSGSGARDDEINNQSALYSQQSSHDITLDFGNGPPSIHNGGITSPMEPKAPVVQSLQNS